jgi:CTP synthase
MSVLALIVVLFTFTLKVVPHITNAIQEWIERVAMIPVDGKEGPADVCVIELGGTIGSII